MVGFAKECYRMKLSEPHLIGGVAVLAFLIFFPTSLAAQTKPSSASRANPYGPTSNAVREMRERDMNIRRLELEKETAAKATLAVSKETVKQVNEDFAQIQEINAEIMRDYVAGRPPDYKHIAEAMAEIKKRAGRLNTNLALPADEPVAENQPARNASSQQLGRSPLIDLNELIYGFVTNPIFKNANTIDFELGVKAKRDLASIIDLSDRISKSAEKLSKVAAKPH